MVKIIAMVPMCRLVDGCLSDVAVGSDRSDGPLVLNGFWFGHMDVTGKAVDCAATRAFDLQLAAVLITAKQLVAFLASQIVHYYSPPLRHLTAAFLSFCLSGKMRPIPEILPLYWNLIKCIKIKRYDT